MRGKEKIAKLLGELSYSRRVILEESKALQEAKELHQNLSEALMHTQKLSEAIQERVHKRVSDLVSRCLESVFGEESYSFRINFSKKRGKTEAELVLVKDGEEYDPLSSCGGGVIDVVSFALRLSVLLLSRPRKRRVLILDENFKHLSVEYRPQVKLLLEELSTELGVQMIIVTHSSDLACGKVIKL